MLPKSTTAARISGNADVVGWDLPAEHERALGALRLQARSVTGAPFCGPAGPYRTPAELWDEEEDKKGEGGEKGAKEA